MSRPHRSRICERPRPRRSPRSLAARGPREDRRPCGPPLLQGRGEPDAAAGVPIHAHLLGIRDGGCRALRRRARRLARNEAPVGVSPLEPWWLRSRAGTASRLMPPIVTEVWNAFLVHPLVNLLVLADYFVHDFGLAVVIVTVAIRLALFPVFRAQVRSSRAMQELAPVLNALKKKHGNDRAKLQQEQMKLYQERGINPIGGCLPMVVFFPVLFAMYAAFQQVGGLSGAHALTVEQLRDTVLWPFLQFTVADRPSDLPIPLLAPWIPWVSNLAQPDLAFFGLIGPLPIISSLLQLVASIQALPRNPVQTDDPTQRTMQSMTYYLPLITIVFFRTLASGVFIYYITTTIFQIIQQYFVMGCGQLPRWIPPLANIPTPADKTMRAREQAAIAEAEHDMEEPMAAAGGRRHAHGGGGPRPGGGG